jgi:glutathione peroxidase-family protein
MISRRFVRGLGVLAAAAAFAAIPWSAVLAGEDMPGSKPAEKPKQEPKEKAPELPKAPDFSVKDLDGKDRTLGEFAGKWVVLEWINLGCPFVRKHYDPSAMQALQQKYKDKGVVWLSVCSTNPTHKDYRTAADFKKDVATYKAVPAAVLLDSDGVMGKAYGAKTTPEIRIINGKGEIVYQGAIDDDPSMKGDPSKANCYVSQVLDAVLDGKAAPVASTKPYGCSVKYAK